MIRHAYLFLAISGLVGTWYFNTLFIQQSPSSTFDLLGFIAGGFANPAASSLSIDLIIASTAGLTWMMREGKHLGMKYLWGYIILTFTIAFAFAFPLFLWARESKIQTIKSNAH